MHKNNSCFLELLASAKGMHDAISDHSTTISDYRLYSWAGYWSLKSLAQTELVPRKAVHTTCSTYSEKKSFAFVVSLCIAIPNKISISF